jgi:hypothetical protein
MHPPEIVHAGDKAFHSHLVTMPPFYLFEKRGIILVNALA